MLQTPGTYGDFQPVGFEGTSADLAPKSCTTAVNESEAMPFARMVAFDVAGTQDRSVKLTNAAADDLFGVTLHSHFVESFDLTTGVAQVSTLTVGGVPDDGDTYSFDLSFDGGTTLFNFLVTRAAGVPVDNDAIAAALRLLVNNDPTASLEVTATGAAAAVVITNNLSGSFAVLNVASVGGTLVHALTTGGETDGIPQFDAANVLRMGSIWVRPEDAVTPASGVFVRVTANAGVGTALGGFRGTADGGNTRDISALARWATSSQGGGEAALAKLIVNMPGG